LRQSLARGAPGAPAERVDALLARWNELESEHEAERVGIDPKDRLARIESLRDGYGQLSDDVETLFDYGGREATTGAAGANKAEELQRCLDLFIGRLRALRDEDALMRRQTASAPTRVE